MSTVESERLYGASYPPALWAPPPDPATGAVAGIPGTWTPAGAAPPATVADLAAGVPVTVTASPATAWTTGQYVQTATTGTTGRASWNGTAWVAGAAALGAGDSGASPAPDAPVTPADDPGAFTIADIQEWVGDDAALAADVATAERARGDAARTTLLAWLDQVAGEPSP